MSKLSVASLLLLLATALRAQGAPARDGGTITGLVVDPAGHPVAGADAFIVGETKRGLTDSTGRFEITKLDAGFYRVRVRRLGFLATEITTDLSKNGRVELKFELRVRPAFLDSVLVTAEGKCPELSFFGFHCRKRNSKGVFLTDDDLLDRGAVELGDVFRGVEGFRIEMVPGPYGAKPKPLATHGAHCLNALVNGRALALTNQLPRYAYELLAVEIYALPGDVPPEYARYVWQRSARQTSVGTDSPNARCSLVVYWTARQG